MIDSDSEAQGVESKQTFISEGKTAINRFLATCIHEALYDFKVIWGEQFIELFPILEVLQKVSADSRAVIATKSGVSVTNSKVAKLLRPELIEETLRLGLEERVLTVGDLVRLIHPDVMTEYLDQRKLWRFVTMNWTDDTTEARLRVGRMLELALEMHLLQAEDLVDGLDEEDLACLSGKKLAQVARASLSCKDGPFTGKAFLKIITPTDLAEAMPTKTLFDEFIIRLIAQPFGLVEEPVDTPEEPHEQDAEIELEDELRLDADSSVKSDDSNAVHAAPSPKA